MLIAHLSLTAATVVQLIGLAIPLVVAFVAHKSAPGWVKGGINAVLAAVTGAVGVLVSATGGYDWQAFIQAIVAALVASAASYVVVVKHIGGPQLEQIGLSLGKSLGTTISEVAVKHVGKHTLEAQGVDTPTPLPTPNVPPTGNVKTPGGTS
jgi:hypothetical protein